jgi:hypothetical protein
VDDKIYLSTRGKHQKYPPKTKETEMTESTVTPKDLAEILGTDPKTVRKFLRSLTPERAGKGGRWAIPASVIPELETLFDNWVKGAATVFEMPED